MRMLLISLATLVILPTFGCSRAGPRYPGRDLPRRLYRLSLGQSVARIRNTLEDRGYTIRTRRRVRKGVPVLDMLATNPRNRVRRMQMRFYRNRMVSVAVTYRNANFRRGVAFLRRCEGFDYSRRTRTRVECVNGARSRGLFIARNGRRVGVADLATMLEIGLLDRDRLERNIARHAQRK